MFDIETYEATFEIYLEDKVINKQTIQAPAEILMAHYAQIMQQVINDKRPMKLKMTVPQVIWDDFENKQKTLYNNATFSNNPMVAWEESKHDNKQEGEYK
jgi:hypothetical protein